VLQRRRNRSGDARFQAKMQGRCFGVVFVQTKKGGRLGPPSIRDGE
jgi:hypothetical protein